MPVFVIWIVSKERRLVADGHLKKSLRSLIGLSFFGKNMIEMYNEIFNEKKTICFIQITQNKNKNKKSKASLIE